MVLYAVLSVKFWACQHLPKSTNKTWMGSMRGNLHTPSDGVVAAIMQKGLKHWAVTWRLSFCRTVTRKFWACQQAVVFIFSLLTAGGSIFGEVVSSGCFVFKQKRLSSLEVLELEINRHILYHIIHFASEACKWWQTPISFQMQSCSIVIHQFALTWETLHLALKLSPIGHMKIHQLRNSTNLDCTFVVKGTKPNVFNTVGVFITGALLMIRGMIMRDGIQLVHSFFDTKGWIMFIL